LSELSSVDQDDPLTATPDQAAADRAQAVRVAIVMSIVLYAILLGSSFTPEARIKWIQAFGRNPFGLPSLAFVGGLLTILYLPTPVAIYHSCLVGEQARRDGVGFFGLRALLYLSDVQHRHPHLSRSRWICLGGMGYYFAVVAAWIVYTAMLGI
jgi:hypothetical protein